MLYWLVDIVTERLGVLRVFHYLTLRAILSALTALMIALVIGPRIIALLGRWNVGQPVYALGPQSHQEKRGTPTMGGVVILLSLLGSVALWADWSNRYVLFAALTTLAFGAIGFIDDFIKVRGHGRRGLRARVKFLLQTVVALLISVGLYASATSPAETALIVPFFKSVSVPLGIGFVLLSSLALVGSSNAVNLTDGLDGLVILPVVMVGAALGVIAYATGHAEFARYLYLPYLPAAGELVVVCAALFGAGLGFLWFNAHPAQVFMGDVGSLALGALLGVLAVMVRHEIVFCIMAGVMLAETVSVMLQVASFKLTGRRLFRMAPLHHHFELKGWPETHVVIRFWIISFVLVLLGLITLKLR